MAATAQIALRREPACYGPKRGFDARDFDALKRAVKRSQEGLEELARKLE